MAFDFSRFVTSATTENAIWRSNTASASSRRDSVASLVVTGSISGCWLTLWKGDGKRKDEDLCRMVMGEAMMT